MSKICDKCGTELEQNVEFCTACGSYAGGKTETVQAQPVAEPFVPKKYNLITAYISTFKKFGQFGGRSRRSEFWYANLTHFIIELILGIFVAVSIAGGVLTSGVMETGIVDPNHMMDKLFWAIVPVVIFEGISFVPFLALTVRRLHDSGKSGWWYLISFVPTVGTIVILVFAVMDSEFGSNKYGVNPKGIGVYPGDTERFKKPANHWWLAIISIAVIVISLAITSFAFKLSKDAVFDPNNRVIQQQIQDNIQTAPNAPNVSESPIVPNIPDIPQVPGVNGENIDEFVEKFMQEHGGEFNQDTIDDFVQKYGENMPENMPADIDEFMKQFEGVW